MPIMLQAVTRRSRLIQKHFSYLILSIVLLQGCDMLSNRCDDRIRSEVSSADRKYVATLYIRNCGATTDYSSIVSIRESTSKFDGDADQNIVFVVKGQPDVAVKWNSLNEIRVQCRACVSRDILKHESSWNAVRISY